LSPRITAAFEATFSSLRSSRNFRLYLVGHLISAAGTWLNFTASSWLVLKLSEGSGVALGANASFLFGPVLVLGAYGGVLADKHDKRRILVVTQAIFGLVALTTGLLVVSDAVELWMVYGLSIVAGINLAFDNPARQAFTVEMVGAQELTNAVSLNSAAFMFSRVIGAALAGLLIATVGLAVCFFLDALSYVAVLLALLSMRTEELHRQPRTTREKGHLLAGLRYVWRTDDLRRPLLLMALIFVLSFQWQVMVPLLAEQTFGAGPAEFGAASAAAGLGMFLGAVVMANRTPEPSLDLIARWILVLGMTTALVAASPALWIAGALMVPVGFAAMSTMIAGNTMLQLSSAPEARGRVMALYGVFFLGSTPLGSPIVGWVGEHLGARATFLLAGAVAMLLGGAALWVRHRDQAPSGSAVSAG
jgi:MFS family permease